MVEVLWINESPQHIVASVCTSYKLETDDI